MLITYKSIRPGLLHSAKASISLAFSPPSAQKAVDLLRRPPSFWSGKRGSNPRPPPWQGGALPLSYSRIRTNDYTIKPQNRLDPIQNPPTNTTNALQRHYAQYHQLCPPPPPPPPPLCPPENPLLNPEDDELLA
jgi:hypothetical protein